MKGDDTIQKYLEKEKTTTQATEILSHVQKKIFTTCIGAVEANLESKILPLYDALFNAILSGNAFGTQITKDGKGKFPTSTYTVTTNYDAAIEHYWERRGTELSDGLTHYPVEKKFRLITNENLFNAGANPALFKFHGSVNLFRKGTDIYRENVSAEVIEALGIERITNKYGELTLVYPVESTGQEHVTQSPYLDLYGIFRNRLLEETSHNNLWLILGTSLQDTTLCSAMEYALSHKESGNWPVIILLDKHASSTKKYLDKRFSKLKRHLEPLNANIEPGEAGFDKLTKALIVHRTKGRFQG